MGGGVGLSGLGPEQIPMGGIGAPGQLGVGAAGSGGGGGLLGGLGNLFGSGTAGSTPSMDGLIKAFQMMRQDGGTRTLAEMAAEKSGAPIIPEGRFDSPQNIIQPNAQPPQDLGQILAGGGNGEQTLFKKFAGGEPTPDVNTDTDLGGTAKEEPTEEEAAKKLGLTPQQAQVLSELSRRPEPQIPRALSPPRRSGTVAAGGQFAAPPLAQAPMTLAQILGR